MFCPPVSLSPSLPRVPGSVFISQRSATSVLRRERRFNNGLFEEMRPDNLERECYEEKCNFEEAREVFENNEKAMEFYYTYVDGDQCKSSPCQNGGQCKDDIKSYVCWCKPGYDGKNCEIELIRRCNLNNGGCVHFCAPAAPNKVACSCADGYRLGKDGKACEPDRPFPCGRLVKNLSPSLSKVVLSSLDTNETETLALNNATNTTKTLNTTAPTTITTNPSLGKLSIHAETKLDTRIVGGDTCQPGEIPWQVCIEQWFCGGSILSEHWVVTAAHCFDKIKEALPIIIVGENDMTKHEGTESKHHIKELYIHPLYDKAISPHNHDIALLHLKEPIVFSAFVMPVCLGSKDFTEMLISSNAKSTVSGFGRLVQGGPQALVLQKLSVPYVDRSLCKESSSDKVSRFMFCAGYSNERKDSCQGDSGGPHVTKYHDTYFLTGIVSWGEGCAMEGKYGIYTRVSMYSKWIRTVMSNHSLSQSSVGASSV
ncbi:FA9 factor, partial [Amia calva]|nr:FA9 factor [Amia calva]